MVCGKAVPIRVTRIVKGIFRICAVLNLYNIVITVIIIIWICAITNTVTVVIRSLIRIQWKGIVFIPYPIIVIVKVYTVYNTVSVRVKTSVWI